MNSAETWCVVGQGPLGRWIREVMTQAGCNVVPIDRAGWSRPLSQVERGPVWVILAVKAGQLEDAIAQAQTRWGRQVVGWWCWSNGMGFDGRLRGLSNVWLSLAYVGIKFVSDTRWTVTPRPWQMDIGPLEVASPIPANLQGVVDAGEWTATWYEDLTPRRWLKYVVNSCINPLTVEFDCLNGALMKDHSSALRARVEACHAVMEARLGLGWMALEALWEHVVNVCKATASNSSSMREDVRHGRPTEAEFFIPYPLAQEGDVGRHRG